MDCDTKSKIEKEIRKHRKDGGKAESMKGVDDAEMDLKDAPKDRSAPNNIGKESDEMKAKKGGRVKKATGGLAIARKDGGRAEGMSAHSHAGRKRRASGGGCEASPFTSALSGSKPKGRSTMAVSDGKND